MAKCRMITLSAGVFLLKISKNILRLIHFILILTISVSYIYSNRITNRSGDNKIITVALDKFSGIFNPLYARLVSDIYLCDICNELLLDYDRSGEIILKGKTGEVRVHNDKEYTYYGIADCSVQQNGEYYDYNFELREDVYFGDGVNLTADDVIFTMYVMADPSYTGVEQFYTLPICGMEEYRLGISSEASSEYYEIADEIYKHGRNNTTPDEVTPDKDMYEI